MPREPKLQRWTDLIAALLRRRFAATFEDIARDVPAYADEKKKKDAVMRMFERDKDELRSFGISIDTIAFEDDNGDVSGYTLDRKGFYLPYLSLAAHDGKPVTKPRRVDKYGYRALASLVFEPDELEIVSAAAQRVRSLGDTVLAEEAESAIRKLSFDLPIPSTVDSGEFAAAAPMPPPKENVFEMLNDALARRKRVSFNYHTMSTDQNSARDVEPYGLFFLSSHWYLAARDVEKKDLRNFRLNRISKVVINPAKSQTSDYDIPPSFNLKKHAKSKRPWDLGDGASDDAIVDFRGDSGATKAAARLGVAVEGAADRRKFRIQRIDSFARWLLSFGGDAVPVAPSALVSAFNDLVAETQKRYE